MSIWTNLNSINTYHRKEYHLKKIIMASLAASTLLLGAETPFKTHTELGYTNTSGNTKTSAFALDFKGEKQWNEHGVRGSAFAYISEDNGIESKNQWGVELNYDLGLTERLAFNYLFTYKDDKFSGYDYQLTTGPGLVHKTIQTETHTLTTQANILYAEDKYEDGSNEDYAAVKAGLTYTWQIQENLKFIEEANIRTDVSDTENYFAYSKTALQSKINSMLSMGMSYKLDYMNEPPAGKTSTDKTFLVSLIIDY